MSFPVTDFTPAVAVIVPVYNGEKTIRACLDSLLAQHYPRERFEVLVIENGSNDNTRALVEAYPVRLLISQKRGPAAARNLGVVSTCAEIVAFTDADCVAAADWLRRLVLPYQDAGVGGVAGKIEAVHQAGGTAVEQFSAQFPPLVNYISGGNEFLPHLYTANASYRREPMLAIGGFNEGMYTGEDVDLSWRFQLKSGLRVMYAQDAVIQHHHRTTLPGLMKQYRQYGYGEIVLDTLYSRYPAYPRSRQVQLGRMLRQSAALPRYFLSSLLRRIRLARRQITPYEAEVPQLWLRIESSNLRGKLDALLATRLMTRADAALALDADQAIARFY